MASTDVLQGPSPLQRDVSAAGSNLFSKFARSPSRKHRTRPSSESIDATAATPASKPNRALPRPGPHRTVTSPDANVSLNAIIADGSQASSTEHRSGGGPSNMFVSVSAVAASEPSAPRYKTMPVVPSAANWGNGVPDVPAISGSHLIANAAHIPVTSQSANPNTIYQHIHDMSSKRIATLDYMRKAHKGRLYWFNSVQFSQADVSRLPSCTPTKLSRRATNYILLGMSIPAVLDVHPHYHPSNTPSNNAAIAHEYLRSLLALLNEFDSYQQMHPTDGSSASSLSRARIPQMFKRNLTRPRKSSGAPVTDIGLPLQQTVSGPTIPEQPSSTSHSHNASADQGYNPSFATSSTTLVHSTSAPATTPPITIQPPSNTTANFPTVSSFPPPLPPDAPNSTLLPSEWPSPYTHLLTPPLPFAPDFYTVFATLCDVLIDAYQRLMQLLSSPGICSPGISDLFNKVDSRLRKVMVGGIIREFENASREAAKKEMMGVQRVVLGGLMGT